MYMWKNWSLLVPETYVDNKTGYINVYSTLCGEYSKQTGDSKTLIAREN